MLAPAPRQPGVDGGSLALRCHGGPPFGRELRDVGMGRQRCRRAKRVGGAGQLRGYLLGRSVTGEERVGLADTGAGGHNAGAVDRSDRQAEH